MNSGVLTKIHFLTVSRISVALESGSQINVNCFYLGLKELLSAVIIILALLYVIVFECQIFQEIVIKNM